MSAVANELMDAYNWLMMRMPAITDAVVYGVLGFTAAAFYLLAFFSILGSYYKTGNPLAPASAALAAAWAVTAPSALLFWSIAPICSYFGMEFPYVMPATSLLAALMGVPLALWPLCAGLTLLPSFRNAHMASPPATVALKDEQTAETVAGGDAETSELAAGAGEPATAEAVESKKEL